MEAKKPADIPKVVVEAVASEITKVLVGPLLLLLSALAVALIPQVRDRVLPALSKPLLVAIAGISLSINLALLFYLLRLRRQRNRASAEAARLQDLIDNPPRVFRFGVYWDKDLTPYCPVHRDVPLSNWGKVGPYGPTGYICPVGEKIHIVPLQHDEQRFTPSEAKQRIKDDAPAPQLRAAELDDVSEDILILLSRSTFKPHAEEIARHMKLHIERVNHHLAALEEQGYVYAIRIPLGTGAPTTYHLNDKGREFLIRKNII